MENKRQPKKLTSLWLITQGPNENEALESYIERYTSAYSCVVNLVKDIAIQAFTSGVSNESMQYALCDADVTDIEGLIAKAYKLFDT